MPSRQITFLLSAFLASGVLLALLAAALLAVEFDEAWIIASNLGVFHPDTVPEVRRVLTTGGVHLLVVGALGEPGAGAVALARGLSLLSLVLLLVLIERSTRRLIPDLCARLIVLLMVLATPGTVFLGAMGYGVMAAMLLMMSGMAFWMSWSGSNVVRILVAGGLVGVAFATRWTLLPLFPLVALAGILLPPGTERRWALGLGMAVWAMVIFSGFIAVQSGALGLLQPSEVQSTLKANAAAAGLAPSFPTPARITGFASRFLTLTSVPVILAAFALAYGLRDSLPAPLRRVLLGLAAGCLVAALAWVLRSPFLHTRYVWPAVLMGNVAAGLVLAHLFCLARQAPGITGKALRVFCLAIPLGLAIETYTIGVRLVAMGAGQETNNAGYSGQEHHFDAFRLVREQKAMAAFLDSRMAADDRIATLGVPAPWSWMQLSLLTQTPLTPFEDRTAAQPAPGWIITHEFAQITQGAKDWLQEVAAPPQAVFGYRVYKIAPDRFRAPDVALLSDPVIYRFSLGRELSLSGY